MLVLLFLWRAPYLPCYAKQSFYTIRLLLGNDTFTRFMASIYWPICTVAHCCICFPLTAVIRSLRIYAHGPTCSSGSAIWPMAVCRRCRPTNSLHNCRHASNYEAAWATKLCFGGLQRHKRARQHNSIEISAVHLYYIGYIKEKEQGHFKYSSVSHVIRSFVCARFNIAWYWMRLWRPRIGPAGCSSFSARYINMATML